MIAKPNHYARKYAEAYKERSVARAYLNRPPYPPELFTLLRGLIVDEPRVVLELGCGPGEIARGLAPHADRVDAVDASEAMLDVGKTLPDGDHPNLNWCCSPAEEFAFANGYALIVAADSLHWMDWETVFPLMRRALAPNGRLVIVMRQHEGPWSEELTALMPRYSIIKGYVPHDMVAALQEGGLFDLERRMTTQPVQVTQSIEQYIEFWHSRSGFPRQRMGRERAERFDEELRRLVLPHASGGMLRYDVSAALAWGVPRGG